MVFKLMVRQDMDTSQNAEFDSDHLICL